MQIILDGSASTQVDHLVAIQIIRRGFRSWIQDSRGLTMEKDTFVIYNSNRRGHIDTVFDELDEFWVVDL